MFMFLVLTLQFFKESVGIVKINILWVKIKFYKKSRDFKVTATTWEVSIVKNQRSALYSIWRSSCTHPLIRIQWPRSKSYRSRRRRTTMDPRLSSSSSIIYSFLSSSDFYVSSSSKFLQFDFYEIKFHSSFHQSYHPRLNQR